MGLIGNEMAPQEGAPVPQQEPAPEGAAPGAESEELTPEEQSQYDRFMIAVQRALYETDYANDLIAKIKQSGDPGVVIGQSAYEMMAMLDEKTGATIDDGLLFPLAVDVVGEMSEMVEAAGATVGGKEVAEAVRMMVERFLADQGGTQEEVEQILSGVDMDSFIQAIEQGKTQPEEAPQ